ncbi:class I SAM-dependent methyltransferase [Nonomuraea antimicrobica]
MEVVDLGGTVRTWTRAPVRPAHVHLVNLEPPVDEVPDWVSVELADACDLSGPLARRRFDLVFSNSVMEHVGGHERRARFAETAYRLASRHWVQVPYLYFPIEPHWVFPMFQFLPLRVQTALALRWPLSGVRPRTRAEALVAVMEIELLSRTQMRYYFPDSTLLAERVAGLTKSLIAVSSARAWQAPETAREG